MPEAPAPTPARAGVTSPLKGRSFRITTARPRARPATARGAPRSSAQATRGASGSDQPRSAWGFWQHWARVKYSLRNLWIRGTRSGRSSGQWTGRWACFRVGRDRHKPRFLMEPRSVGSPDARAYHRGRAGRVSPGGSRQPRLSWANRCPQARRASRKADGWCGPHDRPVRRGSNPKRPLFWLENGKEMPIIHPCPVFCNVDYRNQGPGRRI